MEKANQQTRPSSSAHIGPHNRTTAIFLISVLALILELLLIRWIGTEINIFAYLQNTVLVVCFMGLGMGCLTCRQPIVFRHMLIPLFILVLLLSVPTSREFLGNISLLLSTLGDLVVWNQRVTDTVLKSVLTVSVGLIATFLLMLLIWGVFVPLGRIMGCLMADHPNTMWAYSVNIAGSLVGIWVFVLFGASFLPPAAWFLAVVLPLFFITRLSALDRRINLSLLLGTLLLSWFAGTDTRSRETVWSPYQKLVLFETGSKPFPFLVAVNNTLFQGIVDLSLNTSQVFSDLYPEVLKNYKEYDFPFRLNGSAKKGLIVGSGTGNDVAGALRSGIEEITAVEIDPAIIELGRKYHPERPYDSSRVKVFIDDARSFFATTRERYDIILFAFLDAHTMNGMTNLRLDHYVYTKESLERAKSLLKGNGLLVLKFTSQEGYISDRLARLLRDIFGAEPLAFNVPRGGGKSAGVLLIAGDLKTLHEGVAASTDLFNLFSKWKTQKPVALSYTTPITTDDWPYLYLRSRKIPLLYYLLALMVIGLFFYTKWRFKLGNLITNWKLPHCHFFFLGAGFLLLEVQNISKAAVVLGNIWQVNAVIISGILVMILFANLTAAQFPKIPLGLVYGGLIGSCIALYFIDLAQFGFLPYYQKATIIGVLTGLPVWFSGIVFIRSFTRVAEKDSALGANLMGSLVGGLLQSVTFITGIKALLLIVAALYCAAMLCSPRPTDASVSE